MRACTFAFYLSLLTPVLAAPLAIPEAVAAPALIADGSASSAPLVIRSFVEREDDEAEEGALAAFVADEDDKVSEDACSAVCATHYIAGAKTEREALCSPKGLQNTLDCALCIDNTWPDTTWQESAMAEYERIVEACEQAPQKVLRKSNRK